MDNSLVRSFSLDVHSEAPAFRSMFFFSARESMCLKILSPMTKHREDYRVPEGESICCHHLFGPRERRKTTSKGILMFKRVPLFIFFQGISGPQRHLSFLVRDKALTKRRNSQPCTPSGPPLWKWISSRQMLYAFHDLRQALNIFHSETKKPGNQVINSGRWHCKYVMITKNKRRLSG